MKASLAIILTTGAVGPDSLWGWMVCVSVGITLALSIL